ncbi:hypothetical protein VARIO8X_50632 [Burkholderiales bacterium 8X]|nr:hypothetical protein VARIO8X_50632 [Burkholderiales bacterium 8X]
MVAQAGGTIRFHDDPPLADEVRAGRMLDRRRDRRGRFDRALDRRSELPGAQLHAGRDEGRRRRAVLSLELSRAGHCRHRAGRLPDAARSDPVRSGLAVFRCRVEA